MLKIISLVVMTIWGYSTAAVAADLQQKVYSTSDCNTKLVTTVNDTVVLQTAVNKIISITKDKKIGLASEFVSVEKDGAFQIIQKGGYLQLDTEPHGAFDATLCGMKNGIIAVVKINDMLKKMFLKTDTIVFAVEGNSDGTVTLSTDHENYPPARFRAIN